MNTPPYTRSQEKRLHPHVPCFILTKASLVVVVNNMTNAVRVLMTSSTRATFCLFDWEGIYFLDIRGCNEYCNANRSMQIAAMGERLLFLAAAEYTMVVPPNSTAGPTASIERKNERMSF